MSRTGVISLVVGRALDSECSAYIDPSKGPGTEDEKPAVVTAKSQSCEPTTYSLVQHPLRAEFASKPSVYGNVVTGAHALNVGGVSVIGPTVSLFEVAQSE